MEIQNKGLAILACVFGALILLFMLRSGHFFKALLLSVLSGVAAFFAVNLLANFTGVALAVNPVTLGVSAVSGIPGVIMLLVCKALLL